MSKTKILTLGIINIIINLFLFSKIKIFLYRIILGYKIDYSTKLGFFSIFICEKLNIQYGTVIGCFAVIYDCSRVIIGFNSKIYRKTIITGLSLFKMGNDSLIGVETNIISRHRDRKILGIVGGGRVIIGNNVHITRKHLFEASSSILLKDNVTIGGLNTCMFTHSYDCFGNFSYGNIVIDKNVYLGTGVIVLPGIKISSCINVGAGAVVSKSLIGKGSYAGNPIRLISSNPEIKSRIIRK